MRKIIRYVFITLILICGLILALPFARFRKNLDTELAKPLSKITQDTNNKKKNIQLFNVLGIALNDPSNQMVMIAENKNNANPDKKSEKLVYISYVVKSDNFSNKSGNSSTSDISKQNNQTATLGYSPLIAVSKTGSNQKVSQQSSSINNEGTNSPKPITKQSGNGVGGGNSNDPTPLGSLPIGDAHYFMALLIAITTLYKIRKTTLI